MANLVSRRPLQTISKITSKKNFPEIITFRYNTNEDDDNNGGPTEELLKSKAKMKTQPRAPIDCDKVYLADAGGATKNIKILIMKALNMLDSTEEAT